MKTQFKIRGLKVSDDSRHWLEESLGLLEKIASISDASIVLERSRESAPAFRAHVLLAVPGPDIHAEARDHTLEAVWLKVTSRLRKQIEQRKARQQARADTGQRGRDGGARIQPGLPRVYSRASIPSFSGAS